MLDGRRTEDLEVATGDRPGISQWEAALTNSPCVESDCNRGEALGLRWTQKILTQSSGSPLVSAMSLG